MFASQATPAGALELSAGSFEPCVAGFSLGLRVPPAGLLPGGVQHLASLQASRAALPAPVPACLQAIVTPLNLPEWITSLVAHPDTCFADYILKGIAGGFRIGFSYSNVHLRAVGRNMPSARSHPQPVEEFLRRECVAGRIVGPLNARCFPQIHTSRFGVIPKSNQPGKWRLILNLSAPDGFSANDGVDPELCSLRYTTVDDAVAGILHLGCGSLLAKVDIEAAYRIIPVHPEDRWLLGMRWQGSLFVDTVLPFGLRSAPKVFTAVADALEWCFRQAGVSYSQHYLDDFLTMGPPARDRCAANLGLIRAEWSRLGVPLKEEKVEGPTTSLSFLGSVLDSERTELRLPLPKLTRMKELLTQWSQARRRPKRDLLSLIGHLAHACKVIRPCRIF